MLATGPRVLRHRSLAASTPFSFSVFSSSTMNFLASISLMLRYTMRSMQHARPTIRHRAMSDMKPAPPSTNFVFSWEYTPPSSTASSIAVVSAISSSASSSIDCAAVSVTATAAVVVSFCANASLPQPSVSIVAASATMIVFFIVSSCLLYIMCKPVHILQLQSY